MAPEAKVSPFFQSSIGPSYEVDAAAKREQGITMRWSQFQVKTALLLLVICASARANSAESICGAKHSPKAFAGKGLAIHGRVVSDGMHAMIVVPDQCPDEGYAIMPSEKDDDASAIIRQAVMRIGAPGTTDKDISVDVDAAVTSLESGGVGIRITQLHRMVITYLSRG